jgi:hypothetical protein
VLGHWKFAALANGSPINELGGGSEIPQVNQLSCYHMMKHNGQIASALSMLGDRHRRGRHPRTHSASVMSSTWRTETLAGYISIKASSTELSRRR